jgi:hypothetical protein
MVNLYAIKTKNFSSLRIDFFMKMLCRFFLMVLLTHLSLYGGDSSQNLKRKAEDSPEGLAHKKPKKVTGIKKRLESLATDLSVEDRKTISLEIVSYLIPKFNGSRKLFRPLKESVQEELAIFIDRSLPYPFILDLLPEDMYFWDLVILKMKENHQPVTRDYLTKWFHSGCNGHLWLIESTQLSSFISFSDEEKVWFFETYYQSKKNLGWGYEFLSIFDVPWETSPVLSEFVKKLANMSLRYIPIRLINDENDIIKHEKNMEYFSPLMRKQLFDHLSKYIEPIYETDRMGIRFVTLAHKLLESQIFQKFDPCFAERLSKNPMYQFFCKKDYFREEYSQFSHI